MLTHPKRAGSQIAVGILSIISAVTLAALFAWLAVDFTAKLATAFEVIAEIVGWILLPLRV